MGLLQNIKSLFTGKKDVASERTNYDDYRDGELIQYNYRNIVVRCEKYLNEFPPIFEKVKANEKLSEWEHGHAENMLTSMVAMLPYEEQAQYTSRIAPDKLAIEEMEYLIRSVESVYQEYLPIHQSFENLTPEEIWIKEYELKFGLDHEKAKLLYEATKDLRYGNNEIEKWKEFIDENTINWLFPAFSYSYDNSCKDLQISNIAKGLQAGFINNMEDIKALLEKSYEDPFAIRKYVKEIEKNSVVKEETFPSESVISSGYKEQEMDKEDEPFEQSEEDIPFEDQTEPSKEKQELDSQGDDFGDRAGDDE